MKPANRTKQKLSKPAHQTATADQAVGAAALVALTGLYWWLIRTSRK
ncbi:hypothetical protein [Lacticaseibacillus camelliae]|nr:hypothetical protein [Lacticaseibacillus camelliae]